MTFGKEVVNSVFGPGEPMSSRLACAAIYLAFLALVGAAVFGAFLVGLGPAAALFSLLLIGSFFWYDDV